jgi:glyceraldehyde-3-phosphate dehydrogenase (NAD(P))
MTEPSKIRVAVNGYGVIGKRVADGVARQADMVLAGVSDVDTDWRPRIATRKGYRLFGAAPEHADAVRPAGMAVAGTLEDLLGKAEVVVNCTRKRVAAETSSSTAGRGSSSFSRAARSMRRPATRSLRMQTTPPRSGGESTRVVSCNVTSIVRTLTALKRAGLLRRARGTLLRRAIDPWESHRGGIMNTLVPEEEIPSHPGPDAQSVDPELELVTMAVKVPETLAHLHYWAVQMTRAAGKDEVLEAFRSSSQIALIRTGDGLSALNTVKELMADLGRPNDNLYEVALWADMLKAAGEELFYAYMVDNQATVIPETIDAIRALTGAERNAEASIAKTNAALGIGLSLS